MIKDPGKFNNITEAKVCIFDFDGTLYPSSTGIEKQIKERFRACVIKRLGLSETEVIKLLQEYRLQYRSSIIGLQKHHNIDSFDFYEELYSGLNINPMSSKPGLNKVLSELSTKMPLYVFSNSNRSFVERGLTHLGIRDVFSELFTVEDNNYLRKPQPEVYTATIRRLDLEPKEILMFDDIPSSLEAAKKAGFITVLVGNGLSSKGYLDLHTNIEYDIAPKYCDFATQDIAKFIRENLLA